MIGVWVPTLPPHLLRYNERVKIAGQEADDQLLVQGFEQVERARLQGSEISLTYFEAGSFAACGAWRVRSLT